MAPEEGIEPSYNDRLSRPGLYPFKTLSPVCWGGPKTIIGLPIWKPSSPVAVA